MKKKSVTVQLEITDYEDKGNGVGTATAPGGQELTAQVPFTMVGDEAVVTTSRKSKGCYRARLNEIKKPSPLRIAPVCAHFGICGGCRWQHIPYDEQLRLKELRVRESFACVPNAAELIKPIIASDEQWRYRNKMEFTFSEDQAGNQFLGLIMDSSGGKVVNLSECHLVDEWYMDVVASLRLWWKQSGTRAFNHHTHEGALRTLTIRESSSYGDRMVILTVSGSPDYALAKDQIESLVSCLVNTADPKDSEKKLSIVLRLQQTAKGMPTGFFEMLLYGPDFIRETLTVDDGKGVESFDFHLSPRAFFQPNTSQAQKLSSVGLQMLQIPDGGVVYDFFCGVGTIGICAAHRAKMVVGVEVCPEAALDARKNAALNGFDNVIILCGAVRHMAFKISETPFYPPPDAIIVDPPRYGVDVKAFKGMGSLNAERILYISCNPQTQAKDVNLLMDEFDYRLEAVQPMDQFPHTHHVESLVVLAKNPRL